MVANSDKDDPNAYCGWLQNETEGKTKAQTKAVQKAYSTLPAHVQTALLEPFSKADNTSGVVVWIPVPDSVVQAVTTDEIKDPHITLTFHGDDVEVPEETKEKLLVVVSRVAAKSFPLEITLNGVARFDGDDEDAIVLLASSVALQKMRADLVEILEKEGIEYSKKFSFTPHMTVAYVAGNANVPLGEIEPVTFVANQVQVKYGEQTASFALGAQQEVRTAFVKMNDEKRYTFGVVYKASEDDEPDGDAHNEYATSEELQESMWDHVREGDRRTYLQHGLVSGVGFEPAGEWVEIVSWPLPVKCTFQMPGKPAVDKVIPAGSAWMGVIWKPWSWKLVKDGKVKGYSFGGSAQRRTFD